MRDRVLESAFRGVSSFRWPTYVPDRVYFALPQKTPSQYLQEVTQARGADLGPRPKPHIVEFVNVGEYSSQVRNSI